MGLFIKNPTVTIYISMKKHNKNYTKLLCDIGEMSGLFTDATSLEMFLHEIVLLVSKHMCSEVCSVYLFYEDNTELILKATKGLTKDSVGRVRLKLGEGLTGLALKELRPICEKNASRSRYYKYFFGIGEDCYESFLAVPILRGRIRIGVMVVQNSKKDYFDEEDIRVLRAITSQLANTIEIAKFLMSMDERRGNIRKDKIEVQDLKFVKGKIGATGIAFAESVVKREQKIIEYFMQQNLEGKYTLDDFHRAVKVSEEQIEQLQKKIEERLSDVGSLIFTAQILMLKDEDFIGGIIDLIKKNIGPVQALLTVVNKYIEKFDQIQDAYLREKRQDVEDIGARLLANLTGADQNSYMCQGKIVIAKELYPSDILKLSSQDTKGVILLTGGVSSHLSILARSLQIPLLISDNLQLLDIPDGQKILLDAEIGNVYINPSEDILSSFKEKEELKKKISFIKKSTFKENKTKDGTKVCLMSNINLLGDVKTAVELNSEGIGLYRTEFPFIVRNDFPTEEEQFVIYKKLITSMPGKEITFRTLDIGGDKVLSYYNDDKEENPFLGMRSIRFSLRHKEIFSQQIRAILRAGEGADVRIMFPMISSLDEFLEAKEMIVECMKILDKEEIPHTKNPAVGLMIELPAVLEILHELAAEADFFSIGTNDFIQYMLAVDRTNEKVSDLYLPHHPAILRALKRVVDTVSIYRKDISVCGDMAHTEKYISYFLGIGVRKFSVDATFLPKIQEVVSRITIDAARKKAEDILLKAKVYDIAEVIGY